MKATPSLPKRDKTNDCSCRTCKGACTQKPGWFLPGEAEKAAKLLGMKTKDFFREKLGVDWWESDPNIYVLAPAVTTMRPGTLYSSNPRGKCVFYKNGECEIHDAKPYECRQYTHKDKSVYDRHRNVAYAWLEKQKQIERLLGEVPISPDDHLPSPFGFIGGFFDDDY